MLTLSSRDRASLRDYGMDTISAADAKNGFSALLDKVQAGPVIISRRGAPIAVVMSIAEFDAHLRSRLESSCDPNILK
jgi:prevent-host-death family protein